MTEPATFAEWWATRRTPADRVGGKLLASIAYAAGVASQQAHRNKELLAEFEALKAEFGTGEGLPEVTPEGEILWLAQHNAELTRQLADARAEIAKLEDFRDIRKARIATLERQLAKLSAVVEAAREWHGWHFDDAAGRWQTQEDCWLCRALAALEEKPADPGKDEG